MAHLASSKIAQMLPEHRKIKRLSHALNLDSIMTSAAHVARLLHGMVARAQATAFHVFLLLSLIISIAADFIVRAITPRGMLSISKSIRKSLHRRLCMILQRKLLLVKMLM